MPWLFPHAGAFYVTLRCLPVDVTYLQIWSLCRFNVADVHLN